MVTLKTSTWVLSLAAACFLGVAGSHLIVNLTAPDSAKIDCPAPRAQEQSRGNIQQRSSSPIQGTGADKGY